MRGSALKRGNTWTAYWFTTDPATGKRRQHTKGGFRTKGDAEQHLNDVVGKVENNAWAPDRNMTIEQLLGEWLAAKKSEGLRPTTLAQYTIAIKAWLVPHVGRLKVTQMTPRHAQNLVETLAARGGRDGKPLSSRSVRAAIVPLKAATEWAELNHYVGRDPFRAFVRPKARATKDATAAWTVKEARAFLSSVRKDRLAAAWSLLLGRGLRRGEVAGLKWDGVNLDGGYLWITTTRVLVDGKPVTSDPKTGSGRRRIGLDEKLVRRLRTHQRQQKKDRLAAGTAWKNVDGYVFTDELGSALHPEYISTRFETLCGKVEGLRRVRLHDLRHTAASIMLAEGIPTKVVQEMLGHSSPNITQSMYQHVLPGMAEDAGAKLSATLFD